MSLSDRMNYAPEGKPSPVCQPGDFPFAAAHLDHGHIYGQCNGLVEAGGDLKWVYDPDESKVEAFRARFPQAKPAANLEEILEDTSIKLVAAAAVPSKRVPLGCRVMDSGKDYFTDKSPFTTLEQLSQARETASRTRKKYMVYYSERLHVECAVLAGQLVQRGAIGRVFQTIGSGPHRLSAASRPPWFFERAHYGGILCDIGSHQSEQFLFFTGAGDARVNYSAAANFNNPEYPELEDFGEASLTADNGASCYFVSIGLLRTGSATGAMATRLSSDRRSHDAGARVQSGRALPQGPGCPFAVACLKRFFRPSVAAGSRQRQAPRKFPRNTTAASRANARRPRPAGCVRPADE